MTFWLYVGITAVLDASAVIAGRIYSGNGDKRILALALSCFAASGYFYVQMLEFAVTAIVNIVFVGFSAIIVTTACYFLFKERISWGQAAGILMILIGVSLL